MTATTTTNIFSNPFTAVYNIINTRSNIADPRDGTGARKFVYDSDPFSKAFDFAEYPYIYLGMPLITYNNESANFKKKKIGYRQSIFVYTIKDGAGQSRTDQGITDMKSIVDDLLETFNDTTVVDTVNDAKLYKPRLSIVNSDSTVIDELDLIEVELELTYETRLTVSA